ncbi:MAG: tyrosine-type recombinase/integrase [Burkholderiaceae bacterium]|nr:tyrosine-type recombinase/integrase [Burkholderiaceae bacterium]
MFGWNAVYVQWIPTPNSGKLAVIEPSYYQTMGHKIATASARARLTPRREPYWHRIQQGLHLGYRKMVADSDGSWIVRTLMAGGKTEASLGKLAEYKPGERFDHAITAALAYAANGGAAGPDIDADPDPGEATTTLPPDAQPYTTWDACTDYVQKTRDQRGEGAAADLAVRYQRWVVGSPIEKAPLSALTADQLRNFLRRLAATPAKVDYSGGTRPRAKSTVNREIAALRAALNHAHAEGKVGVDAAWKAALKAIPNATQRRRLYLDIDQRRSLADAAAEDMRLLIRGMALLPLRPGALAALDVRDYDPRLPALVVGKDKGGHDRAILLPAIAIPILEMACRGKPEYAPLFSRADGARWNKDSWKGPIKAAAKKAGLSDRTTAYTIRHSIITDLVHGGLDLLTVAQISGTSVAMIEKHYGHLRGAIAAGALARLVL